MWLRHEIALNSISSRDRKKVFWKRDTREIRKQELGRYLSSLNWDILNDIKSCNRKEQLFEDLIKTGLDIIMPLKKTKLHTNNQPWITPEFITLIKRRQEAFAQKKMTEFRHYRNLVNRERKRLRDNYFSMKVIHLKGTKPSVWWRELKRISGMQPNSNNENIFTQLKFNEDDYQGNPEEIANRINEAFLQPMREYEPLSSNQGSNFIAATRQLPYRENKMPWIIAATTAISCRIVQFLYYSLCINTTLILEFRC